MADAAADHPHRTRDDMYLETLAAFLRTSAGYFDVAVPMPCQGMSRDRNAPRLVSKG
jgi:hypothetical protein